MPSMALRDQTDVVNNISLPEEPLSLGDHFQYTDATRFPESAVQSNNIQIRYRDAAEIELKEDRREVQKEFSKVAKDFQSKEEVDEAYQNNLLKDFAYYFYSAHHGKVAGHTHCSEQLCHPRSTDVDDSGKHGGACHCGTQNSDCQPGILHEPTPQNQDAAGSSKEMVTVFVTDRRGPFDSPYCNAKPESMESGRDRPPVLLTDARERWKQREDQ